MKHPIKENACYVVHQGFGDIYEMFGGRTDLLNYPEKSMNQFKLRSGIRYEKSIITESAQMISCYDKKNVYMWENGEWVNPDEQTFATSYEIIESEVLGFTNSIPMNVINSESVKELKLKLQEQYKL